MIDKVYFGKRISSYRRKLGLSQTALAEKLNVTSQAVSKWETGAALPDLDPLLELSHLYGVSINELLEEIDPCSKLSNRPHAFVDGIAYFLPQEERAENARWAEEIRNGKWIRKNWDSCMQNTTIAEQIGKRIAKSSGVILEIGAGPGGGFMPYILKENPSASVLISDLSPTVVREWKKFLDAELHSPFLGYAVCNFCAMPFSDGSIDVISDGGGIGNTEQGSKEIALKEVYRVLKPGGLFVTSTGFVTKETRKALPPQVQEILLESRPDIFEDLYEETVLAGFQKIDSVISGGWDTDGDDSTIADLARSLGVNLHFTSYIRYCQK